MRQKRLTSEDLQSVICLENIDGAPSRCLALCTGTGCAAVKRLRCFLSSLSFQTKARENTHCHNNI